MHYWLFRKMGNKSEMPKRTSKKYYGVAIGRQSGIFDSWDVTKAQVEVYPGNRHASFSTYIEAKNWLT